MVAAIYLNTSFFGSRQSANQKGGMQEEVTAYQHAFCWG